MENVFIKFHRIQNIRLVQIVFVFGLLCRGPSTVVLGGDMAISQCQRGQELEFANVLASSEGLLQVFTETTRHLSVSARLT